jgi:hypothetical protein
LGKTLKLENLYFQKKREKEFTISSFVTQMMPKFEINKKVEKTIDS